MPHDCDGNENRPEGLKVIYACPRYAVVIIRYDRVHDMQVRDYRPRGTLTCGT